MSLDRDARFVQSVTGANYQACLHEVRSRRGISTEALEAYLAKIDAVPGGKEGSKDWPLCLQCLKPRHEGSCP